MKGSFENLQMLADEKEKLMKVFPDFKLSIIDDGDLHLVISSKKPGEKLPPLTQDQFKALDNYVMGFETVYVSQRAFLESIRIYGIQKCS